MVMPAMAMEQLEQRLLLAFDPSPMEQESLELLNRMRMDPADELDTILNVHNSDVQTAIDQFHVNMTTLRSQWQQLKAVAPLAWNAALYRAALAHTQAMIRADEQSHQVTGELSLRDRVDGQGYDPNSYLGENVYAYSISMFHAHAAFAIDWGDTPTGIQRPPGHRENMMDIDPEIPFPHREVGIAVLKAPAGRRETGPLLMTQDYGAPVNPGRAYLLGTVRMELNHDGRYDAGEGLGDVTVRITGQGRTYTLTTWTAGAYQMRLAPGTYTVTASGGGLPAPMMQSDVVVGSTNVKVDFVAPLDRQAPRARVAAAPVSSNQPSSYRFTVIYRDNSLVRCGTVGTGDVVVANAHGYRQVATLISKRPAGNAPSIRAVYQITPPGGEWDRRDDGWYTVSLRRAHVKDLAGNPAAAGRLGTFRVDIAGITTHAPIARSLSGGQASAISAAPVARHGPVFSGSKPIEGFFDRGDASVEAVVN